MRTIVILLLACAAAAGEKDYKQIQAMAKSLHVSKADRETGQAWEDHYKTAEMNAQALPFFLQKDPEAWTSVRVELQKLPTDPDRKDVKARLLGILAYDADAKSRSLVEKALGEDPTLFRPRALVRLDQTGMAAAGKQLVKLVKAGKPDFDLVWPAIHLGLQGKAVAKPCLLWAAQHKKLKQYQGAMTCATALALHRLGEQKHWVQLKSQTLAAVEDYMAKSRFKSARQLALQLEFFEGLAKAKNVDVLGLDAGVSKHVVKRSDEVDSPAQLRALVTRLRGGAAG